MRIDSGLEAVRAARHEISHEFGNDPARLIAYYIEMQSKYKGAPLINGPVDPASDAEPEIQAAGQPRAGRPERL